MLLVHGLLLTNSLNYSQQYFGDLFISATISMIVVFRKTVDKVSIIIDYIFLFTMEYLHNTAIPKERV